MLAGLAALCRPHRERSRAYPRGKPGFLTHEDRLLQETDSLLEGDGFEPSVPHQRYMQTLKSPQIASSGRRRSARTLLFRCRLCRPDLTPSGNAGNSSVPEQPTLNQRVQGSIPCAPTNHFNNLAGWQTYNSTPVSSNLAGNTHPGALSPHPSGAQPLGSRRLLVPSDPRLRR
jgi:hypothetical protein